MRFSFKDISSIFISLTLALLVWIAAVREQNPPREDDFTQSIPIEVIAPAQNLVNTTPLPESVRLRLLAPESSWQTLTPSKFKATINLSELDQGLSDVPVRVEVSDRQIEIVEQTPAEVTVNLEVLQAISLPVQIDIMDSPPLGYINRQPTTNPPTVSIVGPASLISQVDRAVGELFIRNSKETMQLTRQVTARNRDDQPVRGLEITPASVEITLPIEQRFGYKDVSVRVQVQGQVAPGYRVSNILVDPPALTVVGNPKGLDEIEGFVETNPINLNQATESIVRTVPLNLPDGVATVLSDQQNDGPGAVQVTVEVTPIEDGITLQRPITQQGIDPDYWWRASPNRADVFLSGPLTQLQALRASDVEVIIDLFGLEPGVHKLQPTVFRPDGLRVDAILPDTIEVTIGRTVTRRVTQQELDSNYAWSAAPNQVALHLSGSREQLESIRFSEIKAVVNLAGLEPGFYRLRPLISLPEGVELDSTLPEAVDVTVRFKASPTPTAAITQTGEISATLTPSATPDSTKDD